MTAAIFSFKIPTGGRFDDIKGFRRHRVYSEDQGQEDPKNAQFDHQPHPVRRLI